MELDDITLQTIKQEYQSVQVLQDSIEITTFPIIAEPVDIGRFKIFIFKNKLGLSQAESEHGWSNFIKIKPLEPLIFTTMDMNYYVHIRDIRDDQKLVFIKNGGNVCFGQYGKIVDEHVINNNILDVLDITSGLLNNIADIAMFRQKSGVLSFRVCAGCHKQMSDVQTFQCKKCFDRICWTCLYGERPHKCVNESA